MPLRDVTPRRSTRWKPAYEAGAHQPYPLAVFYDGNDIAGMLPLCLGRRRVRWLPLWFPFNCRVDDTAQTARCLFRLAAERWERNGDLSFVPRWLLA